MSFWHSKPLEQVLTSGWDKINPAYKKAFFFVLIVNLLAFGFEMTNYSIHHDDIFHLFIQEPVLGIYLGRFGAVWLHYYMQASHIMPFLQLFQGIVLMTIYGLLVSHFWGLRKTMDIVLIASIMCIFPYMAQIYTYNATMAVYPIAHLLVVGAVMLSSSTRFIYMVYAAVLYVAAFSIYQSVISNAAAVFGLWVIGNIIFKSTDDKFFTLKMAKSTIAVLVSVSAGGLIYLACVSLMGIDFDSSHDAAKAFKLSGLLNLSDGLTEMLKGTRSFFFWPEHYFPYFLKQLQLGLLLAAVIICVWLPKRPSEKITALAILLFTIFTPRILQILHPTGTFHNLTLTAYAVVIAGFAMIVIRFGSNIVRNLLVVVVAILIAGYAIQCNWISTVNYLNTMAHYSTITQILSRVRSVPDSSWDGKKVAIFGKYNMPSSYPFKPATGVATEYIDSKAGHIQNLSKLIRDEMVLVPTNQVTPRVLEYVATHKPWPHPESVSIIDGVGVVILSNELPEIILKIK